MSAEVVESPVTLRAAESDLQHMVCPEAPS